MRRAENAIWHVSPNIQVFFFFFFFPKQVKSCLFRGCFVFLFFQIKVKQGRRNQDKWSVTVHYSQERSYICKSLTLCGSTWGNIFKKFGSLHVDALLSVHSAWMFLFFPFSPRLWPDLFTCWARRFLAVCSREVRLIPRLFPLMLGLPWSQNCILKFGSRQCILGKEIHC